MSGEAFNQCARQVAHAWIKHFRDPPRVATELRSLLVKYGQPPTQAIPVIEAASYFLPKPRWRKAQAEADQIVAEFMEVSR